jgi:hypothetical protein
LNSFAVGLSKLVGSMTEWQTVVLMLGRKNFEENRIKGSRDSDLAKRDIEVNFSLRRLSDVLSGLKCSIKIIEQSTARIMEGGQVGKLRFDESSI